MLNHSQLLVISISFRTKANENPSAHPPPPPPPPQAHPLSYSNTPPFRISGEESGEIK